MNMNTPIVQSIAWALVHSLWQSALIYILYVVISRLTGKSSVNQRYLLSTIILGLIPCSFIATTLLLTGTEAHSTIDSGPIVVQSAMPAIQRLTTGMSDILAGLSSWIDLNLYWIVRIWLIGSLLFLLRILSGMAYLYMLHKNALPIAGAWEGKVNSLANGLNIGRKIILAEARVSTPIIIGVLKPVILFPIGLMAGLNAAQVEAVLVHELAHIRRHDFLVNFFQCVIESVFFFNPFVWLLSSRIRVVREHCCDDVVLGQGIAPLVYVKTLAYVEESGAAQLLSPALVGNRNHLLERMKRIMETSIAKREWGKMKLLPLFIALLGLVCASWLSIGSERALGQTEKGHVLAAPDTAVQQRDREGAISYFRYRKDSEGRDPALESGKEPEESDNFAFALPRQDYELLMKDSIPGFSYTPGNDWNEFEEQFTQKFREQFREFFEQNQGQFEKMMKELREQHAGHDRFKFEMDGWSADKLREMEEAFAHINPSFPAFEDFEMPEFPALGEQSNALDNIPQFEYQARAMADMMRHDSDLLHAQEELLKLNEWRLLDNEKILEEFEQHLVEQLIEDGYLKKDEKVRELTILNGEISVNGTKIKEKDQKKYQVLREKYQPRWSAPHRPE